MRNLVHLFVAAAIISTASVALANDAPPYAGAQDDATYTPGFDRIGISAPSTLVASNPAFDDAGYAANAPAELRDEAIAARDVSPFAAAHDDAGGASVTPIATSAAAAARDAKPAVAGCPCCLHGCSHQA